MNFVYQSSDFNPRDLKKGRNYRKKEEENNKLVVDILDGSENFSFFNLI